MTYHIKRLSDGGGRIIVALQLDLPFRLSTAAQKLSVTHPTHPQPLCASSTLGLSRNGFGPYHEMSVVNRTG